MARADLMDADLIEELQKAGLHSVKYGIESADQRLLDRCGKRLDLTKALHMVRLTKDAGIKVHLTFMFGLPGETWDTAKKTVDLACDLDPESVQFSLATPFPGSRFHKELEDAGCLETTGRYAYDGGTRAVVRTDSMSPSDLDACLKNARHTWREHVRKRSTAMRHASVDNRNRVSVVIPTFDHAELVGRCLECVAQQSIPPYDVVVVSDGGGHDAVKAQCARFSGVRCVVHRQNRGFAAAVNHGIQESSGDYILLINDDVEMDKSCLETLQAALDADPAIGFVTPRVLRHDDRGLLDSAGHALTRSGYTFNIGAGAQVVRALESQQHVMGAPGSAAMYRRSMLTEVGLFDEDFVWYLEDLDLSFRAQLWGHQCLYIPSAVATHRGQASTGAFYSGEKVFRTARNTVAVLFKDMPRQLLRKNVLRIVVFLVLQQLFHLFRTGQGIAYFRGLCSGLKHSRLWLLKRKRVLGGRRINDEAVERLLLESEAYLGVSRTRWH